MLIVVHPWDLARLDAKWDLLGRGHIDEVYERHVQNVLRPYILEYKEAPQRFVAYYLGLREFRIHPAVEGLQDFVIYDGDGWDTTMWGLGIIYIDLVGYAENLCVMSFYKEWKRKFRITIRHDMCLPTVGG